VGVVATEDDVATRSDDDVSLARRRAASFGPRPDDPTFVDTFQNFARRYGWRAYALPILVVITIAALLTTGSGSKPATGASGNQQTSQANQNTPPPVASASVSLKSDTPGANSFDTVLKSAALPAGAKYTVKGAGTFRVLKGTGRIVGSGTLHRYTIDVENGITGVDLNAFAALVQQALSDKRSWAGHNGVALQRVDSGQADFHISLTSSLTVRDLCGYAQPVETSCYAATSAKTGEQIDRVVLNVARWVRGDANYIGDLNAYRIYMVNHEDGHALGHQHAHDCLSDGLAPVMMQQTVGLRSAVSHKLCAANPWPYPKGATDAPGGEEPDTDQNSEFTIGD
jgi:hypothetical protein